MTHRWVDTVGAGRLFVFCAFFARIWSLALPFFDCATRFWFYRVFESLNYGWRFSTVQSAETTSVFVKTLTHRTPVCHRSCYCISPPEHLSPSTYHLFWILLLLCFSTTNQKSTRRQPTFIVGSSKPMVSPYFLLYFASSQKILVFKSPFDVFLFSFSPSIHSCPCLSLFFG